MARIRPPSGCPRSNVASQPTPQQHWTDTQPHHRAIWLRCTLVGRSVRTGWPPASGRRPPCSSSFVLRNPCRVEPRPTAWVTLLASTIASPLSAHAQARRRLRLAGCARPYRSVNMDVRSRGVLKRALSVPGAARESCISHLRGARSAPLYANTASIAFAIRALDMLSYGPPAR
ncbi:hypothetical protein B0H15DRAFT_960669 [Mycena belliarum]|uniref:Uncharacterized protein n=1 Tax=Mycena belliarum TaxID=1033014 RepID=A0AAD6UM27_9AGAR|nr:hypothetical protein B0H15DRAFT_960669 [Mycena belliae]